MNARELLKELTGIALLGIALFLLFSVVSFHAADLPSRYAPTGPEVLNWGGSVGAALSGFLLRWVGTLGSLAAGLFVAHFGWTLLRGALTKDKPEESSAESTQVEPLRRIAGGVVMVLVLGALERALVGGGFGSFAQGLHPGGYWGSSSRPSSRRGWAASARLWP